MSNILRANRSFFKFNGKTRFHRQSITFSKLIPSRTKFRTKSTTAPVHGKYSRCAIASCFSVRFPFSMRDRESMQTTHVWMFFSHFYFSAYNSHVHTQIDRIDRKCKRSATKQVHYILQLHRVSMQWKRKENSNTRNNESINKFFFRCII